MRPSPIADFICTALHGGCGVTLTFNAPFALRATTTCIPVS